MHGHDGCQKVSATWLPEGGCRPMLDPGPAFYPNEEEFKDTLKYIASIRPIAEPFGICRIVPPHSWQPPCPLRDKGKWQKIRFCTRVQQIHKLQNRQLMPTNITNERHKRRRLSRITKDFGHKQLYNSDFESECLTSEQGGGFGFDAGPKFTLEEFQKYANEFKDQYFRVLEAESNSDCVVLGASKARWAPSVENIEGEYWRLVEKATEQIEVLYGADLETKSFGSGFPKAHLGAPKELADPYVTSGWNLNNIARLPGSMLSFEGGDISGVVVPWLYIGMCFSSFCWHVEDHHFYSLNYMHWGAPKVWYGVPGHAALKFENAMRKHLPDLFEEQPDLLQKLVTQLSPSILKSEGVPVYRCVQQAGEFILTFPRAYHAGFNCGFNCAEAVNVAPVDWLPHGQIATQLYQDLSRKTSVSHDKLLLGASKEAVKILWEFSIFGKYTSASAGWHGFCGKNGLLTKALKARVERERLRRACLPNSLSARRMDCHFDAVKERECFACYYDLHLSAVGCDCHPEMFACLEHASQLCACAWSYKFFLYRYDVTELDILIDALGGKRTSINRWATQDLGLQLTPPTTMLRMQQEFLQEDTSSFVPCKSISTPKVISPKDLPSIYEAADGQDRSNDKHLPTVQDSQLATHVETIVLSDDEEDGNSNFKNELKEENFQRFVMVKDYNNEKYCNKRTEGVIQSFEKHFHKEKNESKELHMEDTCLTYREQSVSMESEAPKYLTTDKGQIKQHEAVKGSISYSLPNSNGNIDMHALPMKLLSHLEAPIRQELESQSPSSTEASVCQRDSFKTTLSERTDSSGMHPNCQKPCHAAASDVIGMSEHRGPVPRETQLDNGSKTNLEYPNTSDLHKRGHTAGALHACANYDVLLLDVGVIQPCKPWYDSQTIFPRGFRSCVSFYSVLDPTKLCSYISEIVDAGFKQPLFKVTVAGHPTEVFMHVSIDKCWELVQEKLNKEIIRLQSLGKENIPHLQLPRSLNGLEMFGLTSPPIVRAIEMLDHGHQCAEYWAARPTTSQVQYIGRDGTQVKHDKDQGDGIVRDSNFFLSKELPSEINNRHESNEIKVLQGEINLANPVSSENVYVVLEKLFKRATPNELWTLHKVLSSESWSSNWKAAFRALAEELKKL